MSNAATLYATAGPKRTVSGEKASASPGTVSVQARLMPLGGLVSTLLVAYLALVGGVVGVVLALSPFREVTRGGLAVAETLLLAAALAGWWLRGRPGLPLGAVRPALRQLAGDPLVALFL